MPEHSVKNSSAFWKAVRSSIRAQHQAISIEPAARNGNIPLSFGQERLWFVEQLQPGGALHNLRAVFRLKGVLDVAALKKSLQEIVRRHEILRTTFSAVEGQPAQVISKYVHLHLSVSDIGELPGQQQETQVRRLATREAQQPFDLAQGPLLRVKLLRLAKEEHILLRTVHHIVFDRWSDSVFMRELAALYGFFSAKKPLSLPDPPIQYADFAQFQRQWLQGEVLRSQFSYWNKQLNGTPPLCVLQLPTDYAPLGVPTYKGASRFLTLPGNLTRALKDLSRQEGLSLFVILLAAFKTLLYQYSGQEDIVICSPVAGRNRVETKKLIGYFNNIVPMRTWLGENPDFRELANRVAKVASEAHQHQDLPLQQLADSMNIPGIILSRTTFALQNVPSQPLKLENIDVEPLDIEEGIANFDLFLSMKIKAGELMGVLRYKTELFKDATITRMLENFQSLLKKIVAHPELRLGELPRFMDAKSDQVPDKFMETDFVAPQKEIEQIIAGVWQEVLGVDNLGIHTNFSDTGGRSLAMVRICSKLQAILDREILITELFKYPTISAMAHYLTRENCGEQVDPGRIHDRTKRQKQATRRQRQLRMLRRKSHG